MIFRSKDGLTIITESQTIIAEYGTMDTSKLYIKIKGVYIATYEEEDGKLIMNHIWNELGGKKFAFV